MFRSEFQIATRTRMGTIGEGIGVLGIDCGRGLGHLGSFEGKKSHVLITDASVGGI